MLGLLGTVQGMVQAFGVIARSTVSPKPSELAQGITLALVTTLEGLIIAIPAIIAFALFKNRQARLVLESGMVADNLMSRFASVGKRRRPLRRPQRQGARAKRITSDGGGPDATAQTIHHVRTPSVDIDMTPCRYRVSVDRSLWL
jgi:hypothetical protein